MISFLLLIFSTSSFTKFLRAPLSALELLLYNLFFLTALDIKLICCVFSIFKLVLFSMTYTSAYVTMKFMLKPRAIVSALVLMEFYLNMFSNSACSVHMTWPFYVFYIICVIIYKFSILIIRMQIKIVKNINIYI